MISWFLRLFPAYRAMEERLQEVESTLLMEQDRSVRVQQENTWLREKVDESLKNERLVYQMELNFKTQREYGLAPFQDAPRLAEDMLPVEDAQPIPAVASYGGRLVDEARRKFIEKYAERMKKTA